MNNRTRAGSIVAAISLSACHVGPQIKDLDLAQNPEGATIEVQVVPAGARNKLKLEGELLEMRDDGVILLGGDNDTIDDELIFVAWARAARIRATQFGGYRADIGRSLELSDKTMERFRLISRYPQGISGEIMENLLEAYRQSELRRFDP